MQDLIGLTAYPATRAAVVDGALVLDHGPGDPEIGRWVRALVEKVLLPVHAAHPIALVALVVEDAEPPPTPAA